MTTPDPWHFARPDLAQAYLNAFKLGLSSAKGVFARRRMGKTEFLLQDLVPAAQAAGYLTAYVNLWENRSAPAAALVEALAAAMAPKGVHKVLSALKPPVKKVKASGKLPGVGEAALEAELGLGSGKDGGALATVLQRLDRQPKRLLLIVDEAQVLAANAHSDFTHALRAALDTRKRLIHVVFAGSSEATLRRMFARASEPFYNWAPLEPFPLLDDQFVIELTRRANELSKFPLDPAEALLAFEALNRTPEFFRRYLAQYLTHANLGAGAALAETKAHVFNDANFITQWKGLLPADREVLRMMAEGIQDLHGLAARTRLGTALGLEKPADLNTPKRALARLQADGIVARLEHGKYQFEDTAFAEWVRQLDN